MFQEEGRPTAQGPIPGDRAFHEGTLDVKDQLPPAPCPVPCTHGGETAAPQQSPKLCWTQLSFGQCGWEGGGEAAVRLPTSQQSVR